MTSYRMMLAALGCGSAVAACGGGGGSGDQGGPPPPTVSLSASPTTVTSGASANLTWSTTGATGCSATGGWSGSKPTSGSESTGALTANTTFGLNCTGAGGSTSATVSVAISAASPPPSVSLSASPTNVAAGGSSTLSWSASNATSCQATGAWTGARPVTGSGSVGPINADSTYNLTCDGPGGSGSGSVTVTVGGSAQPPSVTLTEQPAAVIPGAASTLTWSATNSSSCSASGGWSGTRSAAGSESTGALTATSTYTITCTGPGGTTAATVVVEVRSPGTGAVFPLAIAPNGRYLIDRNGKPFLIQGDAAWSLIAQLKREDVEAYLQDRLAKGFNTLLVNLIEHKFATNAPRNAYGDAPFMTPGDFSTPGTPYFTNADWVLQRAHDLGFAVLLVPAYLGGGGGDEGWYQELNTSPASSLTQYGQFLGQRYRSFDNVVWTYGGDYDPPNRGTVTLIADGIRQYDMNQVGTAHTNRDSTTLGYWGDQPWATLNTVYTYDPVYSQCEQQYGHSGPVPFILMESVYENEQSSTTARIRTQSYQALLSGAAGQVFGNNPIWHFDGPGIFATSVTWQQALGGPGSRSMARLRDLFTSIDWWTLQPDTQRQFLTSGLGTGQDRAVAASSTDGALAVAYVPSIRNADFNLSVLTGPTVHVTWYDPVSGTYTAASGSPFSTSGTITLRAPAPNAEGSGDWVILFQSGS